MSEETNRNENSIERRFENNSDWAVGIALILAGGLFMLDSFNIVDISLTNWWAVFILIPGLNMAVNGYSRYRRSGSTSARNSLFWGLVLILVAFSFFFNISWELIFPVFLIGLGGYLLLVRK